MDDKPIAEYGRMLKRLAVSMGLQCADAEDVAQEILVKALSTDKVFDSEEHRKAWLLRVGTNACIDFHRRMPTRKDRLLRENESVSDRGTNDHRYMLFEIEMIVRKLDAESRAIVFLSCYMGMKSGGIAKTLGMTSGIVRTKLHRARRAVRKEWRK